MENKKQKIVNSHKWIYVNLIFCIGISIIFFVINLVTEFKEILVFWMTIFSGIGALLCAVYILFTKDKHSKNILVEEKIRTVMGKVEVAEVKEINLLEE